MFAYSFDTKVTIGLIIFSLVCYGVWLLFRDAVCSKAGKAIGKGFLDGFKK
jgi:hypothetical protein